MDSESSSPKIIRSWDWFAELMFETSEENESTKLPLFDYIGKSFCMKCL